MANESILRWLPIAFPVFFVGIWLFASAMLGLMSGWFNLQQWYSDDEGEEPLLKLGGQSGSMGFGVALNGCLILRAYPSGLGVAIWRAFAPFQKPLRIPWSEIEAEPSSSFLIPMVKLHLGKPENGMLKISARSWSRLVDAVPQSSESQFQMPAAPPASAASVARAMFMQLVIITAILATVFYFVTPRSTAPQGGVPIALWIGFPAIIFGIAQLIRFARES